MITTSSNVPSHLYLDTLQCLMCYFLIRLPDLLNVDLMLPFFLYGDLQNHHLSFILLFVIVSLHVICKDWLLSSSVTAQGDTCD